MENKAEESTNNTTKVLLHEINEPVLFKNILCTTEGSNSWKLLDWSLEEFAEKLGDSKLPFRVGKNSQTVHPQWEVDTPIEHKTLSEFLSDVKKDSNASKWYYFDYKHMSQWFQDKPDIMTSFNWQLFGLNLDGFDSTMWIGSKGAHTNCHQDTYGCNLVAQVHGRKIWLLFSPECSNFMDSTRIPFEESTIYSKYNFFTPNQREIEAIKKMPGRIKIVTLERGDVLYIPKGWWHYVESLETSMSVNIWLPLEEDCYSRLREALVNLVVNTIGDGIPKSVDQGESNLSESIRLLETSIKECKKLESYTQSCQKKSKSILNDIVSLDNLEMKYPNHVKLLVDLNSENIDFIKKNNISMSTCDVENNSETVEPSKLALFEEVVDAFCNPEVISKVSEILSDKFINRNSKVNK